MDASSSCRITGLTVSGSAAIHLAVIITTIIIDQNAHRDEKYISVDRRVQRRK
jgi:hypothetical protein